jgi:processive 1,2-diacylglycerol beta-glucosyltransferase
MVHSGINLTDAQQAMKANKAMTTAGKPFLSRFVRHVRELAPDAIVCTMQWPLHVLHDYAVERGVPIYAVITDYSVQSTWLMEDVAGYFVASTLNRDVLLARGVPLERIQITGIPVRLEIAEPKDRDEMRRRHELPLDQGVITIFGGGIAVERVRNMVENSLKLERPGVVNVVAGRNKDLTDGLKDLTDGPQMRLRLLDFITYVDDLVAASDIVVTKPGGLMTSEVLARGTPMIVIDPVPGQEEWNADFVAASGAGVQVRVPELVPRAIDMLLAQPERLALMRAQATAVGRPRAAFSIAERVIAAL